MPTYYLDYEGGNDGNDGTSFANRWKTITSGATAARIAAGDTIRIMGSPAPTSLGTTATWTNKNKTVTLASARNVLITDCNSSWTASANVTTSTAATSRGTAAKFDVAAGFTTGKIAYLGLGGAQDYSAYQGITLWFYYGAALAGSTISIKLCSDTIGDTAVDTFTFPAQTYGSRWFPIHFDKGSALGSSIQSIAVYADLDPGTVTFYFDNISTTKAAGDDCLTLQTLIGKNQTNDGWWALRNINGVTLELDFNVTMTASTNPRGYAGTTESVTTYIRKTIPTAEPQFISSNAQEVQDSGSSGNVITFSGGWDRTAMTTQNLETWFDGRTGYGNGIATSSKSYITIDKINLCRYDKGFVFSAAGNLTIGDTVVSNCGYGWETAGPTTVLLTGTFVGCQNLQHLRLYTYYSTFNNVICLGGGNDSVQYGYGVFINNESLNNLINTLTVKNCYDAFNYNPSVTILNFRIGTAVMTDNARHGFIVDCETSSFFVGSLTSTNNGTAGLYLGSGECIITSLTTSGNTTAAIYPGPGAVFKKTHTILKSSMAEATKIYTVPWSYVTNLPGGIKFTNYNGTAGDHRFYIAGPTAEVFSESSVRHTASGLAWRLSPTYSTIYTSDWPLIQPVARVAVLANQTLTVSLWMRRSNTGISGKLVCRGGQIAGISVDTSASISVAQDTWEKLTLVLGPTEDGVVEFEAHVWGGSTYSIYIDDFSAAQA